MHMGQVYFSRDGKRRAIGGLLCEAVLLVVGMTVLAAGDTPGRPGLALGRLEEISEPILDAAATHSATLTLEECIRRGLANNLDIRIGSYDPAIQMTDVVRAEAAFDAVVFATGQADIVDQANFDTGYFERSTTTSSGTRVERIPTDPYDDTHDYNYSAGLRKRLPTGSQLEIAQLFRRYRNYADDDNSYYYNPFNQSLMQVQLRQPLLRDFGLEVNRASIVMARNNYRFSRQQFHLLVIETAQEIESYYWQLIVARQQYKVFEALFYEAQTTLEKLQARRAQDTNTELLTQTQALMARAKASMVSSRNSIMDQQVLLLESMNDPNLNVMKNWEIIPGDLPTKEPYAVDYAASIEMALQRRPEIMAQRIRMESADIAVGAARNQILPRLDLYARQQYSGAGTGSRESWRNEWEGDTVNSSLGLSLEYPLGNRDAEAFLQRKQKEKKQETARLDSIREQIVTDVKISLDAVVHSQEEINERTQAAQAEINTLEAFYAQISAATGTTPEFLDRTLRSQERVASALLELAHIVHRYNLAIMNAQRSQGTLLQYDNIKLEEAP